jgi:hypothetical protein
VITSAVLFTMVVPASVRAEEDDPHTGGPIFVSTGGPYRGTVGEPIEFDVSSTSNGDGAPFVGYYWDWLGDNRLEVSTFPVTQHTWHSAYRGEVHVYVFDEDDDMGHAAIDVVVTGPETTISLVLNSHADLHLYGPRKRHLGLDYETGKLEEGIPGAVFTTFEIGADGGMAAASPDADLAQSIEMPLYSAGAYQVKLVGTDEGPFDLSLCSAQDGVCLVDRAYTGRISPGEIITIDVTASCPGGRLSMTSGDLVRAPGLVVEPAQIELIVEAGKTYDTALTVSEVFGKVPMKSVKLKATDIDGPVTTVKGSSVTFDLNGFEVAPNEQQEVHASFPMPVSCMGKATGAIEVKCGDVTQRVPVTLRTPGKCWPHCNGIGPFKGKVGEPIVFDASNSYDPDGRIVHYCWDWDGGGTDEYTDQPVVAHTWDAEFCGTVQLCVIDDDDLPACTDVEVTIVDPNN